ncbi:hypothetical protein SMMN14_00552 [Sphaerulina musiva]
MSPSPWPIKKYSPRHSTWPYTPQDFHRQDPSPDTQFYHQPRFVTHIDDAAIADLREYYRSVLLPGGGGGGSHILDFCSSWISHYPGEMEDMVKDGEEGKGLKITGLGMNYQELEANPILNNGRICWDLNVEPDLKVALTSSTSNTTTNNTISKFDISTSALSIDYLTSPISVLSSLLDLTNEGGSVHLVISNRCFPTKAIARWLRVDEEERVQMVGDFLHFAGWKGIEIVEEEEGSVVGC